MANLPERKAPPTPTPSAPKPTVPAVQPSAPQNADPRLADKRYKLIEATMRRYGYQGNALIESLHTAQEAFGYLDEFTLQHVARALHLPYSKVYGVATFYNYFTLKPSGAHVCVVCLGTACYIKGARQLLSAVEKKFDVKTGGTTSDKRFSLLTARCFGSCAMAPVVVMDGETLGKLNEETLIARADAILKKDE